MSETVAFTGSAAFNANGNTIHAAFHPLPFIPGATPDDPGSTLARSLPELGALPAAQQHAARPLQARAKRISRR